MPDLQAHNLKVAGSNPPPQHETDTPAAGVSVSVLLALTRRSIPGLCRGPREAWRRFPRAWGRGVSVIRSIRDPYGLAPPRLDPAGS